MLLRLPHVAAFLWMLMIGGGVSRVAAAPTSVATHTAFAQHLASQRGLSERAVQTLLRAARTNATVARLIAPARSQRQTPRAWPLYRQQYVEPIRIRDGVAFLRAHARPLARAQARYGVPAAVITAVIGVETLYGRQTGNFRVLDTLVTLAFHYPEPERTDRVQLFREQLADLIELHFAGALDATQVRGSFAGAIGMPQFMPGSIKRYAVDGDGDGRIDLHGSVADAILSVGNFLHVHGWQPGLPVFAPVRLPDDAQPLVTGGLTPTLDWPQLQAAGARIEPVAAMDTVACNDTDWRCTALGVINLVDARVQQTEYRVATPNFFALTHYNRSYFYAAAVADLAAALQQHMD